MQLATVINDYTQPYGARLRCRQAILQLACYTGFAVDNDHLLSTAESSQEHKNKPAVDSSDSIACDFANYLAKVCELFGRLFGVSQNAYYGSAPNA